MQLQKKSNEKYHIYSAVARPLPEILQPNSKISPFFTKFWTTFNMMSRSDVTKVVSLSKNKVFRQGYQGLFVKEIFWHLKEIKNKLSSGTSNGRLLHSLPNQDKQITLFIDSSEEGIDSN